MKHSDILSVLGILGALGAVSLLAPPAPTLWLDEAIAFYIATLPWGEFWELVSRAEANMSLYFLLLKLALPEGAHHVVAVRGLSVLFAGGALVALYFLAKRYLGPRVALLSGFLLALNPDVVHYAWDARGYSLNLFLAVLLHWLFWKWIQSEKPKQALIYGLVAGISLYSHLILGALVGSQMLFGLCYRLSSKGTFRIGSLVGAGVVLLAVGAPMMLFLITRSGQLANVDWIPVVTWDHILRFFVDVPKSAQNTRFAAVLASCAVLGACVAILLQGLLRGGRRTPRGFLLYLGMCTVLPVTLTFLAQPVKPLFISRYFLIVVPSMILLCAWAMTSVSRRGIFIALACAFFLLQVWGLYAKHQRPNLTYFQAVTHIAEECAPNSALYFTVGYASATWAYFRQRVPEAGSCITEIIPRVADHRNFQARIEEPWPRSQPGRELWILYAHRLDTRDRIHRELSPAYLESRGYTLVSTREIQERLMVARLAPVMVSP